MPTDLCRYCGSTYDLIHGHTCTPTRTTTGTGTPEEATRNVDPAEVQSFPELCLCGHPHSHHGSRPGQICITCDREDHHPSRCWGWFPQGSKAIEVDEHGEEVTDEANPRDQVGVDPTGPAVSGSAAGPADLDHAIQAGSTADAAVRLQRIHDGLCRGAYHAQRGDLNALMSGAGALEELQATRDRLVDLEDTARNVLSCLHAGNVFTAESLLRHALDGPAAQEEGGGG